MRPFVMVEVLLAGGCVLSFSNVGLVGILAMELDSSNGQKNPIL